MPWQRRRALARIGGFSNLTRPRDRAPMRECRRCVPAGRGAERGGGAGQLERVGARREPLGLEAICDLLFAELLDAERKAARQRGS